MSQNKETSERINELSAVNTLWRASYKKLEEEYEKVLESNAKMHQELKQAKHEKKLYFDLCIRYTAMLDKVYDGVKEYRVNEPLYKNNDNV